MKRTLDFDFTIPKIVYKIQYILENFEIQDFFCLLNCNINFHFEVCKDYDERIPKFKNSNGQNVCKGTLNNFVKHLKRKLSYFTIRTPDFVYCMSTNLFLYNLDLKVKYAF